MEDLSSIVRRAEVETLLCNARLTGDWPDCDEKFEEAKRQVRMAMYKAGLGQISNEERNLILKILRPCCPGLFASVAQPFQRDGKMPIIVE